MVEAIRVRGNWPAYIVLTAATISLAIAYADSQAPLVAKFCIGYIQSTALDQIRRSRPVELILTTMSFHFLSVAAGASLMLILTG